MTNTANIFQLGSQFPVIASTAMFMNEDASRKMKLELAKRKVLDYLSKHNKIRLSDLAEKLDIPPRLIGSVLHELEAEGAIKEVD